MQDDYYHLLAEKIYKLKKAHEARRNPGTEPVRCMCISTIIMLLRQCAANIDRCRLDRCLAAAAVAFQEMS